VGDNSSILKSTNGIDWEQQSYLANHLISVTYGNGLFVVAGGVGTEIDLDGDGHPDVRFSRECGVILQLDRGRVIAMEVDRPVSAAVRGWKVTLDAHMPLVLSRPMAAGLHR